MARVLYYIVENAKKGKAKVRLGPYIFQKALIRYGWCFSIFKMLK